MAVRRFSVAAFKTPAARRVMLLCGVLPTLVGIAVLLFAWPASQIQPRNLPVGLVGDSPSVGRIVTALQKVNTDSFELKTYASDATARRALRDRDVYGVLEIGPAGVTVLTASAASPAVARVIDQVGLNAATSPPNSARSHAPKVTIQDVVSTGRSDPQGAVLAAAQLPLTICSIITAALIALVVRLRPALRVLLVLPVVSALAGLATYLVVGPCLGVVVHNDFAAWATFSLLILAMSATTTGLISVLGSPGLGLGALLLVFIGNSFSASSSAPELLPGFAHYLGQVLPPGAGATLLRDVIYFHGHDAGIPLTVLIVWTLFGLMAVLTGHRSFVGFAARVAAEEARDASALEATEVRGWVGHNEHVDLVTEHEAPTELQPIHRHSAQRSRLAHLRS